MFCDIYDLMDKNEMYARGWVRLFGQMNTTSVAQMAQYATDLMKLKLLHQKDCWRCQRKGNIDGEEKGTGSTHSGGDHGLARS